MREMDRRTIEEVGIAGAILMEVAGRTAAQTIHQINTERHDGRLKTVAIICGGGNNGGDGYVIARHLDSMGYDVDVLLLVPASAIKGDAWTNLEILRRLRPTLIDLMETFSVISADALNETLSYYDIYVDALLGTGLENEIFGHYREVVQYLNEARGLKIAVDIPSGVDANTGRPLGLAFRADHTITFGMAKNGLFLEPGRSLSGEVTVADIGILPETADEVGIQGELLTEEGLRKLGYPRPADAHKSQFGHVGIIAGSEDMAGAAALATGGALVSGAGLTSVATRPSVRPIVLSHHPEAMVQGFLPETGPLDDDARARLLTFVENKSVIAIGPGIGQEEAIAEILELLLTQGRSPVVIDADGLNVLAGRLDLLENALCPVILTPHPGEMARLTNADPETGLKDPVSWASWLSEGTGSFVVLKTATTVIAAPDGRYAINSTGNPGMATGGSGDVLTGLLAGLLGTGMTPWDAAISAVFAHGLAGDLAAASVGQRSLLAGHLLDHLPEALGFLE
jgi:NAD(P)H-hydrate epimerase